MTNILIYMNLSFLLYLVSTRLWFPSRAVRMCHLLETVRSVTCRLLSCQFFKRKTFCIESLEEIGQKIGGGIFSSSASDSIDYYFQGGKQRATKERVR